MDSRNSPDGGLQPSHAENSEGKKVFYDKVDKDLEEKGYKAIPEAELTQGKGDHRHTKPGDGIAIKDNTVIAVEKKAPAETSQYGAGLKNDYIGKTRADVDRRVAAGEVSKDVGLHETKLAQAEYNAHNLKDGITGTKSNDAEIRDKTIKPGYSVDRLEGPAVEKALANRNITSYQKIEGSNGTVTYVWDLRLKPTSGKW
jgi:Zn-dependent metalloprotease